MKKIDVNKFRKSDYKLDDVFINRWSPRAMSGEEISNDELYSLFEAARWAPSSFNNQPWRFVYAKKNSKYWDQFFDFLMEGNQSWANKAAALVIVISKTTFDHNGKFMKSHSFDAGASWENLALQGSLNNLVIHGMQGFYYDKVKEELNISDEYNVEMMIAIGKPGNPDDLSEHLRGREEPSGRKAILEIVNEGEFNFT